MGYVAGEQVVLRDVRDGVAYFEWPVTVVEDADRGLIVSQVPGSVGLVPRGYPDDPIALLQQLESRAPERVERAWQGTRTIGILQADVWWATRLFWSGDGSAFLGYYVDFIRPIERDGSNVNVVDLALDIVITPDMSWSWKDEDHLPIMRSVGFLDDETEAAMERAKVEVLEEIAARRYPFDDSLLSLCPI